MTNESVEHPTAKSIRQSLEMVADDRTRCFEELGRTQAQITIFREALEIIAGERQCGDNLLSNKDVARIALHGK